MKKSPAKALTPGQLRQRALHRSALQAVIWGMPAVNFQLMLEAAIKAKASVNQVVYWSRLLNWKDRTLTPNPDVIYLMPFFDTKAAGPVVMEIPPAQGGSITGSIDEGWQTAVEDVGPAGVDKGKGGKYLILPPDYQGAPPQGYFAFRSNTYRSYAILRSNIGSGSDADVAKAVEYGRRIKVYPLSQAANPPATKYVDVIDTLFDSTIPYDFRFFTALDRFVQYEPWITRDKVMIDALALLGIEKGKAFKPDAKTKTVLNAAAAEARAWLELGYEATCANRYHKSSRWSFPVSAELGEELQTDFAKPDAYKVDERGMLYSFIYFSAKHIGAGQFYLLAINDKQGKALDGKSTYRLKVPANPPVKLYWSAVAYDRETHTLIRGAKWHSRASNTPGFARNADGTVDVFFAPKAPPGKQSNWIPTKGVERFEVLFRFYGPEKPLFDKTWVLPDIERQR